MLLNTCICFLLLAFIRITHALNVNQDTLRKKLLIKAKPRWGLFVPQEPVSKIDIVSVLGRYKNREEFYEGVGFVRPQTGLLSKETLYDKIKTFKFKKELWPIDPNGNLFGIDGLTPDEVKLFEKLCIQEPSQIGCDAIFTSFAKGAENGAAYPKQVDEQMALWLTTTSTSSSSVNRVFDLKAFEKSLNKGKFNVALGWFLYIGLQFGAIYVVFFAPIMSIFFPEFDFYPLQTYLHTSEWGK